MCAGDAPQVAVCVCFLCLMRTVGFAPVSRMVLCVLRSLGLMLLHVRLLWWLYVFLHPAVDRVNVVTGREAVLGVAGLGPVLGWGLW